MFDAQLMLKSDKAWINKKFKAAKKENKEDPPLERIEQFMKTKEKKKR